MLAVAVFALWRGREPVLRALGAVVLVTAVAYVFTPLTAAGEEGQPISFVWNVRYLAPAVAVGLAILPCLPALRATPRRRAAVLAALTVLLAFTVGSLVQWDQGHTKGAVAAAVAGGRLRPPWSGSCARGAPRPRPRRGACGSRWRRSRRGVAVAAGYGEQDHYLTHRYENTGQGQDLAERAALVARHPRRPDRRRRHPRRVHAVPLLRHRPLEPGAVAGRARPARRLPADPRLRAVAAGGQRRGLHPRGHDLRPLSARDAAQLARGALDRSRTPTPGSCCATAR